MRPLFLAAIPALLFTVSCSSLTSMGGGNQYMAGFNKGRQHDWKSSPIPDDISYWEGDSVSGPPSVRIRRPLQRAEFYKGSTLVGISRISTGKEGHDTPSGTYKVDAKIVDYRSSTYGLFRDKTTGQVVNPEADMHKDKVPPGCVYEGAQMRNFVRFAPGVGMHAGYLPGYAASHGCVRMPEGMSKKFFDAAVVGMPVIVE
ncbi:MAG: hypothetical protein JWO82_452 [Akkermansiaceae bacterium]|nr:hypothetical protein [Akkermansiaceae bacterium]